MSRVEFVSYDGAFPNLCSGLLVVKIDGKEVKFGRTACSFEEPEHHMFWCSGGSVSFDEYWDEIIRSDEWKFTEIEPEFEDVADELIEVFRQNVPYGCCGGCV